MSRDRHPLAGKTVKLKLAAESDIKTGDDFRVEDWWENVGGSRMTETAGNPAVFKAMMRTMNTPVYMNDNVVYGKVGHFGHIVHESELGEVVP